MNSNLFKMIPYNHIYEWHNRNRPYNIISLKDVYQDGVHFRGQ